MIGRIVQKRILFLLLIFGLAVAYSLVSLLTSEETNVIKDVLPNNTGARDDGEVLTRSLTQVRHKNTNQNSLDDSSQNKTLVNSTLPYVFEVVGISDVESNEQSVLIKFENDLYNYEVNDFLLNSSMQLVKISPLHIDILFDQVIYTVELSPPNLLSKNFEDSDKPYSDLINMTAKDIGSRPRIIEHLIKLTPTPYIADGKLAGPGINPALFEQAGFQTDDVLKTINGKSVTIESEFDEIKKELKTAQTLEFLVMRKGRLVTLYLDIPSETLELVRD